MRNMQAVLNSSLRDMTYFLKVRFALRLRQQQDGKGTHGTGLRWSEKPHDDAADTTMKSKHPELPRG